MKGPVLLICIKATSERTQTKRERARDFKTFGLLKFAHTADHIPLRRESEKRPV